MARVFREEYGRAVAVLVRLLGDIDLAEEAVQEAFEAAVRRWPESGLPPSPAGWIVTTARNRAIDRHRRESTRDDRQAEAAALHVSDEPQEEGAVRDDRLRLIFTCCHPSLAHVRPGRAHAAAARRADHRGDRPPVPRARADGGATAGAGQEQDPEGADPLPRAAGRRPARPAARRAGGALSDLHRRAHGHVGRRVGPRRPVRRGDPAGPPAGRADARRAGGARPARADAARRVAPRGADGAGRFAGPARRAGPQPLGRRPGRAGPRPRPALPAPRPARPVPGAGGDPGRAQRDRRPTGARSSPSTTTCSRSPRRRWSR